MTRPNVVAAGNVYHEFIHYEGNTEPKAKVGGSPANFSFAARALGLDPLLVSRVGKDDRFDFIRSRLERKGIGFHPIVGSERTELARHKVYKEEGVFKRKLLEHDVGANPNLSNEDLLCAIEKSQPEFLYLSGTEKNKVGSDPISLGRTLSRVRGSMIDINRKPVNSTRKVADFFTYAAPVLDTLVFSHEHIGAWADLNSTFNGESNEEYHFSGMNGNFELVQNCLEMLATGPDKIVLHMADKGALGIKRVPNGAEVIHVEAHDVTCLDPIGAGDSFNAAFAQSMIAGQSLERGLRNANAMGAIYVSERRTPSLEEVQNFAREDDRPITRFIAKRTINKR